MAEFYPGEIESALGRDPRGIIEEYLKDNGHEALEITLKHIYNVMINEIDHPPYYASEGGWVNSLEAWIENNRGERLGLQVKFQKTDHCPDCQVERFCINIRGRNDVRYVDINFCNIGALLQYLRDNNWSIIALQFWDHLPRGKLVKLIPFVRFASGEVFNAYKVGKYGTSLKSSRSPDPPAVFPPHPDTKALDVPPAERIQ